LAAEQAKAKALAAAEAQKKADQKETHGPSGGSSGGSTSHDLKLATTPAYGNSKDHPKEESKAVIPS
jgi:hypothetical protein